jgi:flagellar L-ring protein precursor FlgH
MKKIVLLDLVMAALLCGCSSATYGTHPREIQPQATMLSTPIVKPEYTSGSLWPGENSRNMLFTDNKARSVNDIVTIIIDESSSGQNKASTNTSRNSETKAGINALLGLNLSDLNFTPKANPGATLTVGGDSASTLKGAGDTSRGGTLQARLTARVVRVLNNGNLLIEGRRQLTLNAEDQFIVITGVIRPEDIASDNWVLSSNIADARILYTGSGVLADKQHPGWLTRAVDWGWPF